MAMMAFRTPAELGVSTQLEAISGGVTPPINLESQIETMATFLPEMNAAQEAFDMQRKLFEMSQKKYKQDRIDANISLGITGAKTAYGIGTNPIMQKFGTKVWNAIQPKSPGSIVKPMLPSYATEGINKTIPSYASDTLGFPPIGESVGINEFSGFDQGAAEFSNLGQEGGTSLAKSNIMPQQGVWGRIGGFKGIDVPGGTPAKMGISAVADYIIPRSNFGEYMSKKAKGGEKEWDTAAGTGVAFVLNGPIGAGIYLAGKGIQEYVRKNPKLKCIIFSIACGIDSEEVKICRAFRDKYLDKNSLRAYYAISEVLAPIMESNPEVKELVRTWLVEPLSRVGAFKLKQTTKHPSARDCATTDAFLKLLHDIGSTMDSYTRLNGEVI